MSNRQVTYTLQLNSNVRQALIATEQSALSLDNVMQRLRQSLWAVGISFGTNTLINAAKNVIDTTAQFETLNNVVKFSSANIKEYSTNTEFLKKTIDDLKLPIVGTTEAYAKLSAALIGTQLQGQKTRDIFEGVSIASRVMHLDDQAVGRVFLALEQMVSKGKVSSEELRRQLGNALPGAFRLAAEAMRMSQGELMDKLKKGEILSEDFVPKFAAHLKEIFSPGVANAIQSIQAAQADLNNEWLKTKDSIGQSLRPEIMALLANLREAAIWIKENREELIVYGKWIVKVAEWWLYYKAAMLGVKLATGTYQAIQALLLGSTVKQTSAIGAQTAAYTAQIAAINGVTAAVERLNFVQNAQNASFLTTSTGATVANTVGNRYAISAAAGSSAASAAAASRVTAASAATGMAATRLGSALTVLTTGTLGTVTAIVAVAGAAWGAYLLLKKMGEDYDEKAYNDNKNKPNYFRQDDANAINQIRGTLQMYQDKKDRNLETQETLRQYGYDEQLKYIHSRIGNGSLKGWSVDQVMDEFSKNYENLHTFVDYQKGKDYDTNIKFFQFLDKLTEEGPPSSRKGFDASSIGGKGLDATSKIKGNSVTHITINISEMNGMKSPTFAVKNMDDMKKIQEYIGTEVVKQLTGAVNDSQLVGKHH